MITEVKIFDIETFATLFASANPLQINISDGHKATQFQVESGETRSDHVVVNAVEIGMELILTGEIKNIFEIMQQAYDDNQLVGIQTRVKTYQPMLLIGFNHDEAPDMVDGVKLSLRFSQWRSVEPEYCELPKKKVAKKKQADTVNCGKVQTQSVPKKNNGSVVTKAVDGKPLLQSKF